MADMIDYAGRQLAYGPEGARNNPSPHREALKAIRGVLRRNDASDDEYDDALDALCELARSKEEEPSDDSGEVHTDGEYGPGGSHERDSAASDRTGRRKRVQGAFPAGSNSVGPHPM